MMTQGTLVFLIKWLPTLLFILMIAFAALVGFLRGFRKSLILFIHATSLFLILLITFLIISGNKNTDANTWKFVNFLVGGKLYDWFGVNSECKSFTDAFIQTIPRKMNVGDALELVLKDNGQYLTTLASLAARMVLALAFYVIYLVGVLILYIIYFIFYPQDRHKRKLKKAYNKETERLKSEGENQQEAQAEPEMVLQYDEDGDPLLDENGDLILTPKETANPTAVEKNVIDRPPFKYNNRRLFGALLGGFRGFISAFILLSFLGSFLYATTGGSGTKPVEQMEWSDENINVAYDAYSEIATYGSSGIYKVLSAFHNKEDVPYYLFAADLVFKGDLVGTTYTGEEIRTNVILRQEVAYYTKFSNDTFQLILKYGKEDLNKATQETLMDTIVSIMTKEEFKTEFDSLIRNFKSSTYFVNLSFSLLTSLVNHLDELNIADKTVASLVQVMFKKGYYADEIPYEKYLKDSGSNVELNYFTPDIILNRDDAATMCTMLLDVIGAARNKDDSQLKTLNITKRILTYVTDLTIFSTRNTENTDKVLHRMYQFLLNTYFSGDETKLAAYNLYEEVTNPYTDTKYSKISFVTELKLLIKSIKDFLDLYINSYIKGNSVLDNVLNIFDKSSPAYEKNMALWDDLVECLSSSFLLNDILIADGKNLITNAFKDIVPNLELNDIEYMNTTNEQGELVHGEMYYMLTALKSFATVDENRDFMSKFDDDNLSTDDYYKLLSQSSDGLCTETTDDRIVLDDVLDSRVFTLVFSELLISGDFGDFEIYVDDSVLVSADSREITHNELKAFFTSIGTLAKDLAEIGSDAETGKVLDTLISEKTFNTLVSKIIEGTLSELITTSLDDNNTVVIPKGLIDKTDYVSTDEKKSEIYNFINQYQIEDLKLSSIIEDGDDQMSNIIQMFKKLDEPDFEVMMKSNIMYYTMSKYMYDNSDDFLGSSSLIIPTVSQLVLTDEPNIDKAIVKKDLIDLFNLFCKVLPNDMNNIDISKLMGDIVKDASICKSIITSATISNMLLTGSIATNIDGIIVFTDDYKYFTGSKIYEFTTTCNAAVENPKLLESINVLIGKDLRKDTNPLKIDSNSSALSNAIYTAFDDLNKTEAGYTETNLERLYKSESMELTITKRLDETEILEASQLPLVKIVKSYGNIWKETEVSSLVELITNVFNLSLGGNNIYASATDVATLKGLNETSASDSTKTNLEVLYVDMVTPLLITRALTANSTMKIPEIAFEASRPCVTYLEAHSIIETPSILGASGSIEDMNVSSSALPTDADSITTLSDSSIVRATLTKNLNITVDGTPQILNVINNSSIIDDTFYRGTTTRLLVLTKDEIISLINSINVLSTGGTVENVSLNLATLKAMSSTNLNKLLTSNVICPVVSDIVLGIPHDASSCLTTPCFSCKVGGTVQKSNVISLTTYGETSNYDLLTKSQILQYFA